jgi:hypothetical protein
MLRIDIKVNTSNLMRVVEAELPRAVPYVAASMLTALAKRVQAKVQEQIPVAFDRPTPFTVRSVWTKMARKDNLQAEVYLPQSQEERGRAQREYFRPGVYGTAGRNQKRTEALLTRAGVLPPGWVTTPGTSAEKHGYLDAYGNVKPTWYRWVVNLLQLKRLETKRARSIYSASQRRAAKMGVDSEAFVVAPGTRTLSARGSWLPPGVYRRMGPKGETLHQIFKFVRRATYQRRLDLEGIAGEEVATHQAAEFERAFANQRQRFAQREASRAGG